MRKSKKIKKTKHHCGLWQPRTVSRPEALSLGEVNNRGVCTPGHQLLPNILNMSGLHCFLLSWASKELELRAPVLRLWDLELLSNTPDSSSPHTFLPYFVISWSSQRHIGLLSQGEAAAFRSKKDLVQSCNSSQGTSVGATGTTIPTP